MITEFIMKHVFMVSILLFGAVSILLQAMMTLSLKGYVKASANMKTTRKKIMINLKNQFETIYEMNYQVRNIAAYVDKYLLKLRFMGFSYSAWEKMPFLTAGLVTLLAGGEAFYGYMTKAGQAVYVEILFAYGAVLVCLFVFFHIFGIKSRKQQIQIQLVDYLENYLANRLIRTKEGARELKLLDESMEAAFMEGAARNRELKDVILEEEKKADTKQQFVEVEEAPDTEEDLDMLRNLMKEMGNKQEEAAEKPTQARQQIAAAKEEKPAASEKRVQPQPDEPEESEIALLEEFVQSFLA